VDEDLPDNVQASVLRKPIKLIVGYQASFNG
jgi:hypothetical protein